jgi:hypothetical protein
MVEFLAGGLVIMDNEEFGQLELFADKVEILKSQFEVLKDQHELLKSIHQYCVFCRDAFEVDNIKLVKQVKNLETQIMADQYARYHQVLIEDKNFRAGHV